MTGPCISVILPVYDEEGNIAACLRGLARALQGEEHEILVCYDFDEDKTLPAIAAMADKPASVKLVRNSLGRGVAFAIRAGLKAARGDVLVTTMADLSDPPDAIPAMARKIRVDGADVVSGSRYMKGGSQTGGPPFKVLLSRAAGLSLRWLAGVGTHDATSNFRAYSRRFIQHVEVESRHGFELALELTVKAHVKGFKVDEVPSSWQDRTAGESRFKLWQWLPRYLRWYLQAMGAPLFVAVVLAVVAGGTLLFAIRNAPVLPYWPDEWMYVPEVTGARPAGLPWLFSFHNEHRIPLPKLIWLAVSRLSGFDERWGCALNVALMTVAAVLLCRALLRLRGRVLWSDGCVPLLLLHWGHQETMTWPFQVAFSLLLLAFAVLVFIILGFRRRSPDASSPALGFCLLALPFIGAATFPFVVLLAPWAIQMGLRDPDRKRRLWSMLPAAATLLLLPLYFGYVRRPYFPPSPDLASTLRVAVQTFAGSMGKAGYLNWPLSGWIASIATLAAAALLLRGARRIPGLLRPASGMLLMLAALVALALMVGQSRGGTNRYVGFTDRYVTLFAFAPFLLFAAPDLCGRPQVARIVQAALVLPVLLLFVFNRDHAVDASTERQHANGLLIRDVEAGMPIPILACRHPYWCPGIEEMFEHGLTLLADSRLSVYRRLPVPVPVGAQTITLLRDGRQALRLSPGFKHRLAVSPGAHEVRLEYAPLQEAPGELRVSARLLRDGGSSEPLLTEMLDRSSTSARKTGFRFRTSTPAAVEWSVDAPSGGTLPEGPGVWMVVELQSVAP
ncbi:MAG TPA: glycosyltransferase [Planctomycetota bacterium]|nr:glycosyltransferase [Planctomycetota bacterium]